MPPKTSDTSQKSKQQKKAKGKACKQQLVPKQQQNTTAEGVQLSMCGDQASRKVVTEIAGVAGNGGDSTADLSKEATTAPAAAVRATASRAGAGTGAPAAAVRAEAEGGTGAKGALSAAASTSAVSQEPEMGASSSSAAVADLQGHHEAAAGGQDCWAPLVLGETAAAGALGELPEHCRTTAAVAVPDRAPAAGARETPTTGQGADTATAAATGGETAADGTAATAVETGLGAAAPQTAAAQGSLPVPLRASSTLGGSSIGAVAARKARRPRKRAECVVCLDAPAEVLLLPCKHVILCVDCSQLVQAAGKPCPICCTPVEQHVAVANAPPAAAAASLPDVPASGGAAAAAQATSLDASPAASARATATCSSAVPGMEGGGCASYGSWSGTSIKDATSSSSGVSYSSKQLGAGAGSKGEGSAEAVLRGITHTTGDVVVAADGGPEGSEKSAELTALLQTLLAGPASTRSGCSSRSQTGVQEVVPPVVGKGVRATKGAAPCTAAAVVTSTYAASRSSSSLSSPYVLQSGGHDVMPPDGAVTSAAFAAPRCANGAVMIANQGGGQLGCLRGQTQPCLQTGAVPGRSASLGTCAAAAAADGDASQCQQQQQEERGQEQQVGYREFVQEAAKMLGEARGQVLQVLGVLDQTMGRLRLLCDRYGVPMTDVLP